jgi:limonene-1,2-epoxide hydrolase
MTTYPDGYNQYSIYFLNLMMQGMQADVAAETFWNAISDETTFTFHYHFPGFPHQMTKAAYKTWFEAYDAPETGAEFANIYRDTTAGVTTLIMDYAVHYKQDPDMKFLSIVKIQNSRVIKWDDYLDTANLN